MKNHPSSSCPTAARQRGNLLAMRRIRYSGPRADLPWSTSTMAEAPDMAGPIGSGSMANGALSMSMIAPTRSLPRRKGLGRSEPFCDRGRQRRGIHDAGRARVPRRVQSGRRLFWRERSRRACRPYAQVRRALSRYPRRPLSGGQGHLPGKSPLYSVDKIKCPVIILQGDEDAIVPPAQSEMMYKSLKVRGIPTAYLLFKGEQHGFRKAENIQRALEAQLYFFSKILHFPLGEKIPPVEIDNLKNWKK